MSLFTNVTYLCTHGYHLKPDKNCNTQLLSAQYTLKTSKNTPSKAEGLLPKEQSKLDLVIYHNQHRVIKKPRHFDLYAFRHTNGKCFKCSG